MLSIKRASSDEYFTTSSKHDYYVSNTGSWLGLGAYKLGLTGEIEAGQFENIFYGYDPFAPPGEKPLVQNAGKWQRATLRNGKKVVQERRHAQDLTFSVPKSVSIFWALSPEPIQVIISQAHTTAVKEVLSWAEQEFGSIRRGKNGVQIEKAFLVIGLFQHGASRELDPQLHTHCCVLGVGVSEDGHTGQIQTYDFYRNKMLLGAAYRAALVRELEERLAVAVRPHKEHHVKSFELVGVPQEVIDGFSKRSQQIREALKEKGYTEGIRADSKVAERLTLITRKHKSSIGESKLFEQWQREGESLGFSQTEAVQVIGKLVRDAQSLGAQPRETVREGIAELISRKSYFSRYELLRRVCELAQFSGIGFGKALEGVTQWIGNSHEQWTNAPEQAVVLGERKGETQYSTQAMIDLEREMMSKVTGLKEQPAFSVRESTVLEVISERKSAGIPLRQEQEEAVWYLARGEGKVKVLTGVPGAGKTEVLGVLKTIFEREGYRVIGVALQGRTAEDLERKTGAKSETIHKTVALNEEGNFVIEPSLIKAVESGRATYKQREFYAGLLQRMQHEIDERTVVLTDEGSMADTLVLKRLTDAIENKSAQWILAGDANQLAPIGAGGGFAAIAQTVGSAVLTEPVRQQQEWQREQTKHLAQGEVEKAIRAYQQAGRLKVEETLENARNSLIEDWKTYGLERPEDHAILAMTNAEVSAYNKAAQQARLLAGKVGGEGIEVNGAYFYEGDRILFRRTAVDEFVRFRSYGVRNGQFATIELVDPFEAEISVRLDNGARVTIPVNEFPHFRLGYAGTTYFFQGESVLRTFVHLGGSMQDMEQTVVQLTRHKQDVMMYTDLEQAGEDLRELLSQMERSRQKELAVNVLEAHEVQQSYGVVQ
ncbi:MAG: relaxase domain-containing protein [Symploca sp. SIO2C1]|nr:relaxase domain-containing protein [Symploca sp. SIO2C1]